MPRPPHPAGTPPSRGGRRTGRRSVRRRGAAPTVVSFDDERYWRGELDDAEVEISFVTSDGSPVAEQRPRVRRSLISVFGEPVGSVGFDGGSGDLVRRHRQSGGAPLDQGRAAGCREEIQITVLGHPVDIAERVVADERLDELRRLGLSAGSPRGRNLGTKHREIAWDAVVRTVPWPHRPATLRLFGSPSSNVTVLTLTPRRPHRVGVRSFLGVGMRALEHLRDELEALLVLESTAGAASTSANSATGGEASVPSAT